MIADAFHETLTGYVDGVLSGDIVACESIKLACQRHVNDLARQSTPEFPYHFDERAAAKVCRFYPSVLRHSIGRHSGTPFELEPWQVFIEASLFGWKRDADGCRRFATSYESMARKNGKSTKVAGRAILMAGYDHNPIVAAKRGKTFAAEPVAQVILAAAKRDQAQKVIFAEIERMRHKSPSVKSASTDIKNRIEFFRNSGTIDTVGSDKPFDGLNPHFVGMDEIHAWREFHREFHDTMITGDGSRDQGLISYITTAGNDKSHLWLEIYNYARSVLLGTVTDETYFAAIYELDEDDDPFDERNWIKSNPNLGVSVSVEKLRDKATQMGTTEVGKIRFTRYYGNRRVSANATAFDLAKWDACKGELSDWSTADAFGAGVDLGSRNDLAAWAIVAKWLLEETEGEDGELLEIWRYEARVRAYIADDTDRDLTKQPFAGFVYDDLLSVKRYPISSLRRELVEECHELGIGQVAYDPYSAQQFSEEIKAEGIEPVRMAQNPTMFNEPITDLLDVIDSGLFTHSGDALLRWTVSNASVVENAQKQVMFDKSASDDKIDPTVALTMAFRICSLAKPRSKGSLVL